REARGTLAVSLTSNGRRRALRRRSSIGQRGLAWVYWRLHRETSDIQWRVDGRCPRQWHVCAGNTADAAAALSERIMEDAVHASRRSWRVAGIATGCRKPESATDPARDVRQGDSARGRPWQRGPV